MRFQKIFHLVVIFFRLAFLQILLDFQTPNYANGCKDYPSIFGVEAFCDLLAIIFGTNCGKIQAEVKIQLQFHPANQTNFCHKMTLTTKIVTCQIQNKKSHPDSVQNRFIAMTY